MPWCSVTKHYLDCNLGDKDVEDCPKEVKEVPEASLDKECWCAHD